MFNTTVRRHQSKYEASIDAYPLRRAAYERAESERKVSEAVSEARAQGTSWDEISRVLGMPTESVRRLYGGMRRAS